MSEIFEKLLQNEFYKNLLEQLPENEKEEVINSIKKITDVFENNLILPIKNLKSKQ